MTFLFGDPADPWLWALFLAIVIAALVFDLGYLARRTRVLSLGASLILTAAFTLLAILFGAAVTMVRGVEDGTLFFTAFVLEQSLSIDNVFVMSVIFAFFAVPRDYQHRVLFWGILVAMVLRGVFVGLGATMVASFDWILYVFGIFLIIAGLRMLRAEDSAPDIGKGFFIRWLRRHIGVTDHFHGERFLVREPDESGALKWQATPLFLAFMVINVADVVFAVDSVPAVLAMTQDPFIVYTSNIFAILGLRALYFVIAAMIDRFHYLRYALAFLLVFIGSTIFYKGLVAPIPPLVSLSVTLGAIGLSLLASLLKPATRRVERG